MINSIIQAFLSKLSPIWVSKRNDKESTICLTPKPSQSFFVYCIQSKEKIGEWRIEQLSKNKAF